ncbi:MAG TPA: insulinase family protein [Phycisphaerales bacterium]|nr:insulinase family protein [Phycisphaerales bacterium]
MQSACGLVRHLAFPVVGILALVSVAGQARAVGVEEAPAAVAAEGQSLKGALPADPRLTTGELSNGLKYIVLKHSNPPGRANIWLNVSSGSLNETDAQRGIAHYLEHMAFNGSKNFAPGTLIPLFESLGLTFGRHQNAFTSFEQTAYQLSLPDTTDEKMDKAMLFMSDVAFNLSLDPHEIDEERKVILNEKRTRLSAQQRVQEEMLKHLAPGSLIGDRLPIGTEETLMSVMQPDFKAYYGKWYVPSNMTVMVVADAEPGPIVEKIKKFFSQGTKTPRPVDADAKVTPTAGIRGVVLSDPELTNCSVEMVRVGAAEAPVTTYETVRSRLVDGVATAAFNRRIEAKVDSGVLKSLGGGASAGTEFNAAKLQTVSMSCKPDQWQQAVTEMGTEVQRARIHGFTDREIDDVRKELIAAAERAVEQETTRPARAVISSWNNAVANGDTITSAQADLEMYRAFLPSITAKEVNTTFASLFDPSAGTFLLQAPASATLPSNEEFASIATHAFDVKPEADKEDARAASLMDSMPKPGTMSEVATHEASGVTSGWLSNGVRFHHRFMDIRKDQVTISISLAAGTLQETAANRGVSDVAGLAWSQPATKKLSSTNIRDLMTGKKINVRGGGGGGFMGRMMGGGGDDAMSLSVSGSPADLETGLQLAHLLLTEPKIEQTVFDQWKEGQRQMNERMDKDPQWAFGRLVSQTVYPRDDVRTQLMTMEQVNAVTLEASQAWLENAIQTAPIEVAVVGDIPLERARMMVSAYLGSLSPRERISDKTLDSLRALERPAGPVVVTKTMTTSTPVAMVVAGFYTNDEENVDDNLAMQMAAQTLSSRMVKVIREEKQLVYSIRAGNNPGRDWPGFGMFSATAPCDPAKAAELATTIKTMYDEFAQTGPTEEEMTTAKKQMANTFEEGLKDPSWWLGRINKMDYRGLKLDDLINANDAYQAMTPEQVKAAFVKYYKPESFMTISLVPDAAGAMDTKPAGQ